MKQRSWQRLAVLAVLATAGCYSHGYGTGMGGHSGNGVCDYNLNEAAPNKRVAAAADAQAGARTWCATGVAYQTQCPGGGVSVVGSSNDGDVGEAWWFDAAGHLTGYEAWTTLGTCADQRYGTASDCPATASDVGLCAATADATSDSGAFDSGQTAPDVVDTSADVSATEQ
jgi:hypothetical protein